MKQLWEIRYDIRRGLYSKTKENYNRSTVLKLLEKEAIHLEQLKDSHEAILKVYIQKITELQQTIFQRDMHLCRLQETAKDLALYKALKERDESIKV